MLALYLAHAYVSCKDGRRPSGVGVTPAGDFQTEVAKAPISSVVERTVGWARVK